MVQLETPKGLNIHLKIHKAAQVHKYSENPLPWRLHKTSAEPLPSQRPRWAKGRPAGLPQAGQLNKCNTGAKPKANRLQEVIRAVVRKPAATWRHPQAGQPRGGRPAPLCSISSPGFDPVAMRHSHEALSQGLGLGSNGYTERL